jgi:hypothetical protein
LIIEGTILAADTAAATTSGPDPNALISFSIIDRHDFALGLLVLRFLFLRKNHAAGA